MRALLAATVIVATLALPATAAAEQAGGKTQKSGARRGSGTQGQGQHHYALKVQSKNGNGGSRVVHTFSSMKGARKAQQKLQMRGIQATIHRV